MAIEKSWIIKELNVKNELFGQQNVVSAIFWAILIKFTPPEVSEAINYEYNSFTNLSEPGPDFVPYEQITEQQVLSWLFTELGQAKKEELEKIATQQFINTMYTNDSRPPLPWANGN